MDTYQKEFFETLKIEFKQENDNAKFTIENDCINLYQKEDYNLTNYKLNISGTNFEILDDKGNEFTGAIDFNNQLSYIVIKSKNGLFDDLKLDVKYVVSDKKEYDEKLAKEKLEKQSEEYKNKINIVIRNESNGLVNIFFSPGQDDYGYSIIDFYQDQRFIESFKIVDKYWHYIEHLTSGKYRIVLKQYTKDDQLFYESQKYDFTFEYYNRIKGAVGVYR